MWALMALSAEGPVDLLTAGCPDLVRMNSVYETSLEEGKIAIRRAQRVHWLGPLNNASACQGARFQRLCRAVARDYNLLVSAYNLCDFGIPALHFIGDFSWDADVRTEFDIAPRHGGRFIYRDTIFRRWYLALSKWIARPSGRNLFGGEDRIVANSRWSSEILLRGYGVRCDVVYPPVTAPAAGSMAWSEREAGFVCLGRISYEKRIERVVDILSRVRTLGHNIHLHIVGPIGRDPYGDVVRTLVRENAAWVFAEGGVAGEEKWSILHRHRFGIHGRPGEAFGIAIAEQVKAGCIPFVPNSGGQTEIVGHDGLCYADTDDAVRKIDRVLRREALQNELLRHLVGQGRLFGVEQFLAGFREQVQLFLEQRALREGRNA